MGGDTTSVECLFSITPLPDVFASTAPDAVARGTRLDVLESGGSDTAPDSLASGGSIPDRRVIENRNSTEIGSG